MTLQEINDRIQNLESIKNQSNITNSILRQQLSEKEQGIKTLRETINANIFENTEEYKELQELNIVKKWLEMNPEQ